MKPNVWQLPSASILLVQACFTSLLVNKKTFPAKILLPTGGTGPNNLPEMKTSDVSNTLN